MRIGTRVRTYLACILGIVLGVGVFGFVANARALADLRSSLGDGFELNTDLDELRLLFSRTQLVLSASAAAGTTTDLDQVDVHALWCQLLSRPNQRAIVRVLPETAGNSGDPLSHGEVGSG